MKNVRPTIIRLLSNMASTREIQLYLERFSERHGIKMITVADLIRYRLQNERLVKRLAAASLPTPFGNFEITAFENVKFGADAARRAEAGPVAAEALERVGLGARLRHFPHQLSGGEQQRVAIARALATGNPILLADEPTGELDFRTGVQILEVLEEQARAGLTVLVVTHNREISRIADRVIELSSGHIARDGPPIAGRAQISDLQW